MGRACWVGVVLVIAACSFGTYSGDTPQGPSTGGPPSSGTGGNDAGPIVAPTDLPCDVANFLATHCLLCHGPVPTNGAPNRLDSLAALQAPSYTQPSVSNGVLALQRIQSSTSPMPPAPYTRATSTEISMFGAWVNGGMQAGSCVPPDAGPPPVSDAGVVDAGPSDAGVANDLPCGVATTLGTYCTSCHGSPPSNNAPISLNSLAALRAYSSQYPSQTEGQRCVTRMTSTTSPMPPSPYAGVPAAAATEFSSWVSSGMPAGSCTPPADAGPPPVNDGGVVDAGPSDAGVSGDLPCNVAAVLTGSCTTCHGNPPTGGAPMALTSLAQLQAASPSNPAITNGQACVQRMASATNPMPPLPAPPVSAASQSAFSAWVSSGMPAGSCGVDAGTDPVFSGPPTCTSGTYWTQGEDSNMRPGEACIACHSRGEGPRFAIAGTAYPTGHEYDDCNGSAAQGAVVSVTDSAGTTHTFTVNSAGNFSGNPSGTWPVFPIRAQISFDGKTRMMAGAVSSGDCNTCHTLQGANGAPGRVALP